MVSTPSVSGNVIASIEFFGGDWDKVSRRGTQAPNLHCPFTPKRIFSIWNLIEDDVVPVCWAVIG
jgi:hypothetical protein